MLFSIFITFFKIGLFTFGGGYAMIAQIKETIVEKHKWITEEELLEIIAIAESTPGPIAINMATFVGFKKKGVLGSACATLGVVLPSLMIIFIISLFLDAFMANQYVKYAFVGIKCAVAFLILKAGITMISKPMLKPLPICIMVAVTALMILFELLSISFSAVFFIIIGGIIGIVAYSLLKSKEEIK